MLRLIVAIKYINGDATLPQGDGKKLVIHIVNDIGRFGSGFAKAVMDRYPIVRASYIEKFEKGNPLRLADVQFVKVNDDLWFANMVGQSGVIGKNNPIPIKYDAVRKCLQKVKEFAQTNGMTIFGPKFGSQLAGGNWTTIEKIIDEELTSYGVDINIYCCG